MRRPALVSILFFLICPHSFAASPPFSDMPGWSSADHAAAWSVFHDSCAAIEKRKASFKSRREQDLNLNALCAKAVQLPRLMQGTRAKSFFEQHFEPQKLTGNGRGLMTGYYEPEFEASAKKSDLFHVPVLRRPPDLVSEIAPPGSPELKASRKLTDGRLVPYFERQEIEEGALNPDKLALFWMKDAFELFTMQVQGSGRLRLEDGRSVRLAYDGKNGRPYTAIGKVMLERGLLQKGNISMQAIGAVLARDKKRARDIMNENKSYVFFRVLKNYSSAQGPIGAQGVPLTPFYSIAVDRDPYTYGLPFFIDGALPQNGSEKIFRQLVVAQDTGTAIKGAARIDLFVGSGAQAAELAGVLQQRIDLYVLQPKGIKP